MARHKPKKKRRIASADWRPAGFSKAEMRIIDLAKQNEKSGKPVDMAALRAIRKKVDG